MVALAVCIFQGLNLPINLSNLSRDFQKICYEMLPSNSNQKETLASLVCGQKVNDQNHLKTLQKTGLIHIFVVSGGHLILLSELSAHLRWPWSLRFLFLTFFTLFTGFQVPCVRSLFQFLMSELLIFSKHHLRADQKVFFSGLFILLIFSEHVSSLSLQLSWGAALALAINLQLMRRRSFIAKTLMGSILVYMMMYPLLSPIAGLHPLSIAWNISLGTVMTVVLFPLCGLAVFNNWALWLLETVMPFLWDLLNGAKLMTSAFPAIPWKIIYGWVWLLSWHALAHLFLITYHRKNST
jgi:predicted membrane metal-binding protein